jgi:site-specific recombinase XerD
MSLAVVRNLASPRALRSAVDEEDVEQEIVDQYALALAASGTGDRTVSDSYGHDWVSTTSHYIHVHAEHIERQRAEANERAAARLRV